MLAGRYIPGFDSLRAIAVIIVMVYHANKNIPDLHLYLFKVFRHGYLGVDLFFVLSGFLITGILLRTRSTDHFFRNFYARRVLRIWPLYFAILLATFVLLPIARPAYKGLIAANCHPMIAYPLFVQNLFHHSGIGPVQVTWSLAVEEQFYIVWALFVFFFSDKALTRLCLVAVALSPFFRLLALHAGWSDDYISTFTLTRLDGLAAGCLLAFIPFRLRHSVAMLLLGGVGLPIALHFQWKSFVASFALLFFSGVILMANRGLIVPAWTPLRYVGKISYGLYLLHVPVFDIIREFAHPQGMLQSMAVFVFAISAAIAAASLSWFFLESPILRWKRYFESECATPSTVGAVPRPSRA
jgi:peptidoglycan/LPS O-acetylase OafA/YrhL